MNPTNQQNKRSSASLAVVLAAIALVLLLLLAGSLYFNMDRGRLIRDNERLQGRLSLIQGQIQDLQESLEKERSAQEAAQAAASQAREELSRQQQHAQETAQRLQKQMADFEQRVASAEMARADAESQLARETSLRKAAEEQIASFQAATAESAGTQPPENVTAQPEQPPAPTAPPAPQGEPSAESSVAASEQPVSDPQAKAVSPPEPETASREADTNLRTYDVPPRPIRRTAPKYPYTLKQAGVEGSALLSFTIDATGRVQDIEVSEAIHPEFAEAAVEAVGRWRFEPASSNGKPVACRISQRLEFAID